jgi:hypothetical protein
VPQRRDNYVESEDRHLPGSGSKPIEPWASIVPFSLARQSRSSQGHHDYASCTRSVELRKEHALPGTECESAVCDRNQLGGSNQRSFHVRDRVSFEVAKISSFSNQPIKGEKNVMCNVRISVLVDEDSRRRVWHVNQQSRALDSPRHFSNIICDVDKLSLFLGCNA